MIDAPAKSTAVVAFPDAETSNIVTQPRAAKGAGSVKGQVRAVDIGKGNRIPSAAANNGSDHDA
jgi:hypothetical protein